MAGAVGGGGASSAPEDSDQAQVLRPGLLPLPQRRRALRRALPQLHPHRCRLPLQAHERLQCAAPDGLGRLRPAGRERGHQEAEPPEQDGPEVHRHTTSGRWTSSASATTGRARSTPARPDYYKWTQWIFLLLYKRGLAYRSDAPVNWCPSCGTVLANEEVEAGAAGAATRLVEKRDLPQWFFRITAYADRLIDDLDTVDWPESHQD